MSLSVRVHRTDVGSPAIRPSPAVAPWLLVSGALVAVGLAGCSSDATGSGPVPTTTTSPEPSPSGADTGAPATSAPATSAPATSAPATSAPATRPPTTNQPPESAPPPGRPTCVPSALTVTDADARYTADAVQELFTVRTSGPDCQLASTYPRVQVLDAAGTALGAVREGGFGLPAPTAAPTTLSAGTSLSFFVATHRDGSCVPAATLTVTFAGTATTLRAATALQVCGGELGVGPVQRLADDE